MPLRSPRVFEAAHGHATDVVDEGGDAAGLLLARLADVVLDQSGLKVAAHTQREGKAVKKRMSALRRKQREERPHTAARLDA